MPKRISFIITVIALLIASTLIGLFISEKVYSAKRPEKVYDAYITINGLKRYYRVHLPEGFNSKKKYPLLLVAHCSHFNNHEFQKILNFDHISNTEKVIVVYPQALGIMWRPFIKKNKKAGDSYFISKLIDHLGHSYNIDNKKVFLTGISSGAGLTCFTSCKYADKITAAAPISGIFRKNAFKNCHPSKPLPLLILNGLNDEHLLNKSRDPSPIEDIIQFWVKNNKCSPTPKISALKIKNTPKKYKILKEEYTGCQNNADIHFYKIINGPHICYSREITEKIIPPEFLSKMIWDFFEDHSN